ncbi:hypothetical protein VP01_1103g2 [Puccinia sorghi]|uniref:Uncharacterized protein n=1 Tax=Puccinia sorghi TaxID=27349 RepID=A0A0L6VU85_9BASI|nr:hypothetical protein VP01_1103g2 [Puccinia sorghi]
MEHQQAEFLTIKLKETLQFTLVRCYEWLKKGDLVVIDAKFVDYKSDGTRLVRRPSQMTLARVSMLSSKGSKTGVPFIKDHIQKLADYLTEFSVIRYKSNKNTRKKKNQNKNRIASTCHVVLVV